MRKLEVPQTHPQTFGTVLHQVIERYLKADDLGRDERGNPVELYPPGWEIAQGRFGTEKTEEGRIDPIEQDLVKRLIAKAIEEGVLERAPGRKIEGEFRRSIKKLPCPVCKGEGGYPAMDETGNDLYQKCEKCKGDGKGANLQILGYIDILLRDAIHDHKSTKSMKYAKSPNKLAQTSQMLLYAHELLEKIKERGEPIPKQIELRHNVYSKEGKVRKVIASVTPEQIENHWHRFTQDAEEMERLRQTAEQWHEIQDPVNPAESCNAYGGCPFRSICSGHETEQSYSTRMQYINSQQNNKKALDASPTAGMYTGANNLAAMPAERTQMSFADALAKRRAANAGVNTGAPAPAALNSAPPAAQPVTQAAPVQQVAAPVAPPPVQQVAAPTTASNPASITQSAPVAQDGVAPPPWANPTCAACKGIGFNSKGAPCRICDTMAKKNGKASSELFHIEPGDAGKVIWIKKDDDTVAGESFLTGSAPAPVTAKTVEQAAPAPAAATVPPVQQQAAVTPAAPVAAPATPAAQQPAVDEEKGKTGRPRKGFILMLNAAVTKGSERLGSGRGVIRLDDLLMKYGTELAKQNGVASYYELDTWKRRDNLAAVASIIAEDLGADFVVATGIGTAGSDLKNLYDALRPFAGMEIVAHAL